MRTLLSVASNLEDIAVDIELGKFGSVSSTDLDTIYDAIGVLYNISGQNGVYDSVAANRELTHTHIRCRRID